MTALADVEGYRTAHDHMERERAHLIETLAAGQCARRAATERAERAESELARARTLIGSLEHALARASGMTVTQVRAQWTDLALPRR
jgi:hypothetical protein